MAGEKRKEYQDKYNRERYESDPKFRRASIKRAKKRYKESEKPKNHVSKKLRQLEFPKDPGKRKKYFEKKYGKQSI